MEIPTQVFLAVREPREQDAARSSQAWIWRKFDDVVFSGDREYYRCEFPTLNELLANPRVNATDSLVLSVQIQSRTSVCSRLDDCHACRAAGCPHASKSADSAQRTRFRRNSTASAGCRQAS